MTRSGNTYFQEEGFADWMTQEVEPYLRKYRRQGCFPRDGKIALTYHIFQCREAKSCIVISHGFCEFAEKYNELVYYFLKAGISVYIIEHRGHGSSGREIPDAEMVYVERYEQYVEDFVCFVERYVKPKGEHRFLFAHSMGGAIAALVLEQYPHLFEGAILSTPMCRMKTGKYPLIAAQITAEVCCMLGKEKDYALGQGGFRKEPDFAGSSCLSEARYQYIFKKRLENRNYCTYGGSYGWVRASIRAGRRLMQKKNLRKIEIPVLLFSAGKDHMVDNREIARFYRDTKNTEYICIPDAKHEIFNAGYRTRKMYYEKIFTFIKENEGEKYETETE